MAVTAYVFDMGETLVDETRQWEEVADAEGVPRFTFMALAGAAIARGELPARSHQAAPFAEEDLYPDALPCLRALRKRGTTVGVVGNMAEGNEAFITPHVDFVGSSQRWGVSKPDAGFFARIAHELERDPSEIAYVGDRVDNDVAPALAFGMHAVHIKRGPWGHLHETPPGARRIESLLELVQ